MIPLTQLNRYRHPAGQAYDGGDFGGAFLIPSSEFDSVMLKVIAGNGMGWDHVSVSTSRQRCPTWDEMEQIKRMFFKPDETAFQLHMPPADHISHHPYVLHIWRPHHTAIPVPPSIMV